MVSNTLRLTRDSGGSVSFSRSTDIASPTPGAIVYTFNLSKITGSGTAAPTVIMRVGSGFSTANADEADGSTFSRLGINITTTAGTYQLRNLNGAGTNSANITGNPVITWVMNKTGATYSYLAPNGSVATVGNNAADVWVGTALTFDEMTATTSSAGLT